MKLLIMNGPNLNLLGQREKDIYGERSFDSYLQELKGMFPEVELDYFQSNVEGELINRIHEARGVYNGVILNAGGYTHTSVALADAIGGVPGTWCRLWRCTSRAYWPGRSSATSR